MKAVVATFNQEKALVGAFSVIVQLHRLIVYSTSDNIPPACARVGELLEVLLHGPGLGVYQPEAGDVDVVVHVGVQVHLVNVQACHWGATVNNTG